MPRTLTAALRAQTPREAITPSELASYCLAAAKLSLRGWEWADIADCSAHVVTVTLEKLAGDREHLGTGTGRDVVAYLKRAEHVAPGMLAACDAVPRSAANLRTLQQIASKWRRSVEAERRRDADDARAKKNTSPLTSSTMPGSHPARNDEDILRRCTPWGARITAMHLLDSAGLLGATVDHGPLWTLAYSAARVRVAETDDSESKGVESREVAEELGITWATYRQHLKRATERLRASEHDMPEWATALLVDDPVIAVKATATRSAAADMGDRSAWRGKDSAIPAAAPVSVKVRKLRPRKTPAPWTASLPQRTQDRLAAAAANRRAREAELSPEDRAARRREAGIPELPSRAA